MKRRVGQASRVRSKQGEIESAKFAGNPGLERTRPVCALHRYVLAAGIFCLLLLAAPGRSQQESAKQAGSVSEAERAKKYAAEREEPGASPWAWANFAILVAGLGYLIRKKSGPFFAARSLRLRKEILEAEETRKSADARAAGIDRRLANLAAEIEALRASARREEETEIERMRRQTEAEIARVHAQAEEEIAAAGKAARAELKRYAAELALGLAGQQIRARMTPDAQDGFVRNFARGLERPAGRPEIE